MSTFEKVADDKSKTAENEIRVAAKGHIKNYLGYAFRILNKTDYKFLIIRATGNAITKALILIELVKRRIGDLHQVNKIYSMEIVDYIDPKVEGMDKIEQKRRVTAMDTTLSKEPLDDKDPGYQLPEPREERPLNLDKNHDDTTKQQAQKKHKKDDSKKDVKKDGKQDDKRVARKEESKHVEKLKIEKKERPKQEPEKNQPRGGQGAKNQRGDKHGKKNQQPQRALDDFYVKPHKQQVIGGPQMRLRGRGGMGGPLTRGIRRGGYARNDYMMQSTPGGYMEMRPYPGYYDIVYYDDYVPERMERGYGPRHQLYREQQRPGDQMRGGRGGPQRDQKTYNDPIEKQPHQRGERLPGFRGGMAMRGQNQMQFRGGRHGLSGPITRGDARAQERDQRGGFNAQRRGGMDPNQAQQHHGKMEMQGPPRRRGRGGRGRGGRGGQNAPGDHGQQQNQSRGGSGFNPVRYND